MRCSTASRPVRPGFRLTPVTRTPGSPRSTPATIAKAADEKSPGTRTSGSASPCTGPATPTMPSRSITSTPAARSMRSVWSRDGTGSRTQVSPLAFRPASSTQLFTWALAMGSSCTIPCKGRPGRTASGGVPPSAGTTAAPMATSGSAMRAMGLLRRESSPSSTVTSPGGWPTMIPDTRRMSVPAFMQSITGGGVSPRTPRPVTTTLPDLMSPSTPAPISLTAPSVASVSSDTRGLSTTTARSEMAPSRKALWVIDLSGGTATVPATALAGRKVRLVIGAES